MRIPILASFLALLACGSLSQETRKEVTTPPNASEDSRPNSDSVPDVSTQFGQFERIAIIRLKYGTDLLEGLERAVVKEKIRNGVILTAIGSATSYHYHTVSNSAFPTKNVFIRDTASPADLTAMNGYVINGRVHAHVTFSNPDKAFGGHLERGTRVFTFAIITVGVLKDGVDLRRVDDKTYR